MNKKNFNHKDKHKVINVLMWI